MRCCLLLPLFLVTTAFPAAEADTKSLFREDWAEIPAALPITAEHVANEELRLRLYGGATEFLKKSHHEDIPGDPYYVWSGRIEETAHWAATLSFKDGRVLDLSGGAKLRWRTRQSGGHCLHIVLRTAGGAWLISGATACTSEDWRITAHSFGNLAWKHLAADRRDFTNAVAVEEPDLSAVVEVGFTDLKAGGGSPASSRVDWLEVHGALREKAASFISVTGSSGKYAMSAPLSQDGNLGTHWMAEGDGRWLIGELAQPLRLSGVEIAWWKNHERTTSFAIEISGDSANWEAVLSEMVSTGAARDYEFYPFPEPVEAQYVRLTGYGNTVNAWNSVSEWRVLKAKQPARWFEAYPLIGAWRDVSWLGFIFPANAPWIFHEGMGWNYMRDLGQGRFHLWDTALGWTYTAEDFFPHLFTYGERKWYLFIEGPDPRWFWNLTDGRWESSHGM